MKFEGVRPLGRLAQFLLIALLACLPAPPVAAATFVVNSPADFPDPLPGNGICQTAADNTTCTLRAAIMETSALPGADTITLQAGVTYLLTRVNTGADESGGLRILDSVTINGAGAGSTIIDGNASVIHDSVFRVLKCFLGLTCDVDHPANVVTLHGVTIRNGDAVTGGAINNNAVLTIDECTLADNHAAKYGAGIYNNAGTVTVVRSTISGNTLDPAPGRGAGLYNSGTMTILDSTVTDNSAVSGGGVSNEGGTLSVVDSTISGNFADGDGGGIYSTATTGLYNATIVENLANADNADSAAGGGVAMAGGTLTFANSIIANNLVDVPMVPFPLLDSDDCSGTLTSQGNDIVAYVPPTTCTIVGQVLVADPKLGPLQDNGGPTLTHAIAPDSPALDGGNSGGCTDQVGTLLDHDQRGSSRPRSARCDIGAVESTEVIFRSGFQS